MSLNEKDKMKITDVGQSSIKGRIFLFNPKFLNKKLTVFHLAGNKRGGNFQAVAVLHAEGIGILRVTDERNHANPFLAAAQGHADK